MPSPSLKSIDLLIGSGCNPRPEASGKYLLARILLYKVGGSFI